MRIAVFVLLIAGLFGLGIGLTGCQVYRNNGRNLFESAAPSELAPGPIGSNNFPILIKKENSNMNCWTQPKDEPLWTDRANTNNQTVYQVHFIDDESIEVCSEDTQISSNSN